MIAVLGASCFRELDYQKYLLEITAGKYQSALAEKKSLLYSAVRAGSIQVVNATPSELKDDADKLQRYAEERTTRAEKIFERVKALERVAIHGFWFGVAMLAVFAGVNIVLSVNHSFLH